MAESVIPMAVLEGVEGGIDTEEMEETEANFASFPVPSPSPELSLRSNTPELSEGRQKWPGTERTVAPVAVSSSASDSRECREQPKKKKTKTGFSSMPTV